MNSKDGSYKYLIIAICLLSLAFMVCFTIGFIRNLTDIPYCDSWKGIIWLYEQFFYKNYKAVFSVHNEHPIFLTNTIFLLNYWLFNGSTIALQVLNFILVLSVALMLFYLHKNCCIVNSFSTQEGRETAQYTESNKKTKTYIIHIFFFYSAFISS